MMNIATPTSKGEALTVDSIVRMLKRRQFLAVSIAAAIGGVALVALFIVPQIQGIVAVNSSLRTQETKLAALQKKTAFLESITNNDVASDVALLESVLPAVKPIVPLLSSLETLATESNVALGKFEILPGAVATNSATSAPPAGAAVIPNVYPLPLSLEVTGDFVSMNTFFARLDDLVPIVNVQSIEFTKLDQAATQSALYKADVDLQSLFVYQRVKPSLSDAQLVAIPPEDTAIIEKFRELQAVLQGGTAPSYTSPGTTERNIFE